jgi:hypothetical protein
LGISSEQCGEVLISLGVLDAGEVLEVFFKKAHAFYAGDGKSFVDSNSLSR